jgi:hypothetical protein
MHLFLVNSQKCVTEQCLYISWLMLDGWKGVGIQVSNICGSGGIGIGVLCALHSLWVSLHKPATP